MAAPTAWPRAPKAETLGQMFERQYQTAPELPAMGLAFFRTDIDGHRVLSHDGILPGFNAHLAVAPDDGVAVVALTNGSSGAMRWLPSEMDRLLRPARGAEAIATADLAPQPRSGAIFAAPTCCRSPGDLRGRLAMAGGCRSSSERWPADAPAADAHSGAEARPAAPAGRRDDPSCSDSTFRRSGWARSGCTSAGSGNRVAR